MSRQVQSTACINNGFLTCSQNDADSEVPFTAGGICMNVLVVQLTEQKDKTKLQVMIERCYFVGTAMAY